MINFVRHVVDFITSAYIWQAMSGNLKFLLMSYPPPREFPAPIIHSHRLEKVESSTEVESNDRGDEGEGEEDKEGSVKQGCGERRRASENGRDLEASGKPPKAPVAASSAVDSRASSTIGEITTALAGVPSNLSQLSSSADTTCSSMKANDQEKATGMNAGTSLGKGTRPPITISIGPNIGSNENSVPLVVKQTSHAHPTPPIHQTHQTHLLPPKPQSLNTLTRNRQRSFSQGTLALAGTGPVVQRARGASLSERPLPGSAATAATRATAAGSAAGYHSTPGNALPLNMPERLLPLLDRSPFAQSPTAAAAHFRRCQSVSAFSVARTSATLPPVPPAMQLLWFRLGLSISRGRKDTVALLTAEINGMLAATAHAEGTRRSAALSGASENAQKGRGRGSTLVVSELVAALAMLIIDLSNGYTLTHVCAASGRHEIFEAHLNFLALHGALTAEVICTTGATPRQITPLHLAARNGAAKIVALICERLRPHFAKSEEQGARQESIRQTIDRESSSGSTPLMLAASKGSLECVRCLLNAGADATHHNRLGLTPLRCALNSGASSEVIECLRTAGAV